MRHYIRKDIKIEDLYVNPENFRYVEEAEDEIGAIIAMFKVTVGDTSKEMINLAKDIIEDGLNPFEMPIVCLDEELEKYVVYDGNRRVTCLKLMTQYKNNSIIKEAIPDVEEIYKLEYQGEDQCQCVVFEKTEDAIHYLNKIHNDLNKGIGRKQWDSHAKMKANDVFGNKSLTYAIIKFLKENDMTDKELIRKMNNYKWASKLERVVGFALFKKVYNVKMDENNTLLYTDTKEQVIKMLSKLVEDCISRPATGNFRYKKDFEKYVATIPAEYRSKNGSLENNNIEGNVEERDFIGKENANNDRSEEGTTLNVEEKNNSTEKRQEDTKIHEDDGTGIPRSIPYKHKKSKKALVLGKEYRFNDRKCLNEKGREMLYELESLNINDYPFAAALLCRSILEYVAKLWIKDMGGTVHTNQSIQACFDNCVNMLQKQNIITVKEQRVIKAQVDKKSFFDLLNTWIHADSEAMVSEIPLCSGWKNTRLVIDAYIEEHKK